MGLLGSAGAPGHFRVSSATTGLRWVFTLAPGPGSSGTTPRLRMIGMSKLSVWVLQAAGGAIVPAGVRVQVYPRAADSLVTWDQYTVPVIGQPDFRSYIPIVCQSAAVRIDNLDNANATQVTVLVSASGGG